MRHRHSAAATTALALLAIGFAPSALAQDAGAAAKAAAAAAADTRPGATWTATDGRVYQASDPARPVSAAAAHHTALPVADPRPEWREAAGGVDPYAEQRAAYARARQGWLAECHRRVSAEYADDGMGGALIGGVFGGLLGNRIGGRENRTFGTIAGAAVGAVAGAAIDKSEDRGQRDEAAEYCESYLDYHSYAGGQQGYGQQMMMVPVAMGQPMMMQHHMAAPAAPAEAECTETVTEEWVEVPPPARRYIPPRPAPRDKRVRIN